MGWNLIFPDILVIHLMIIQNKLKKFNINISVDTLQCMVFISIESDTIPQYRFLSEWTPWDGLKYVYRFEKGAGAHSNGTNAIFFWFKVQYYMIAWIIRQKLWGYIGYKQLNNNTKITNSIYHVNSDKLQRWNHNNITSNNFSFVWSIFFRWPWNRIFDDITIIIPSCDIIVHALK